MNSEKQPIDSIVGIEIKKTFSIEDQKPFKVHVFLNCQDLHFKQRVINIIKEKNIDIVIDSYNRPIQVAVRRLFNLGYMDVMVQEYCGRDSELLDECFERNVQYSFENEQMQNEAMVKINKVLVAFLNKEYQNYNSLLKYQTLIN